LVHKRLKIVGYRSFTNPHFSVLSPVHRTRSKRH